MQNAIAPTQANVKNGVIDTVTRHIHAFLSNDLNAVVEDYEDHAILVTPDASYCGPLAIKDFFKGLMLHFPTGHSSFVLDKIEEREDLVYILWHGHSSSVAVQFATDTFIMRGGKIHQQTFAGVFQFIP